MNTQKQNKEIRQWKTNHRNGSHVSHGIETKNYYSINNTTIQGDTTMSTNSKFFRFGIAMAVVLLLSVSQNMFAAGTLAGTVITNKAFVQYNAGVNVRTDSSAASTLTVGYKASINLSAYSSSTTSVDSTILYKYFNFVNTGNYGDNFAVTVGHYPTNWVVTLYKDMNASGTWDGGDSLVTSGGALYLDTAATSNNIGIIAKIAIPQGNDAADNLNDSVEVSVASNGTGPAGVTRVGGNGSQTYVAHVTINKPVISYYVVPTLSTNKIPGESQSYELRIVNTGHAATNGSATVKWTYDNVNLNNESYTGGTLSGDTVSWSVASVAANDSTSLTFSATIEQSSHSGTGVPSGTAITNGNSGSFVTYNDGLHSYSINITSSTSFNVGTASGAVWTVTPADSNGNPGDVIEYQFKLKNTGNHSDNYTLSNTDATGDLNVTHYFAESSLGSFVTTLSSSLAQGDSIVLYVRDTIPSGALDGQTIKRSIVATTVTGSPIAPIGGATAASYSPLITAVTAPQLTVSLSKTFVSGTGDATNPAPGDIIQWTVTIQNIGTGNATSVSSSNMGYAHVTTNSFVNGSVNIDNGTGSFDLTGLSSGYNSGGLTVGEASGVVTVTFSSIPASTTVRYQYNVQIQ